MISIRDISRIKVVDKYNRILQKVTLFHASISNIEENLTTSSPT